MALSITGPRVVNTLGVYNLNFGQLFQGRRVNKVTSVEILQLVSTDLTGEAFVLQIPDEERRFTVYSDSNYVIKDKACPIIVSVVDYKIGSPDKTKFNQDPNFAIYFPGKDLTINVNVTWNNYWVIALIELPVEYKESASAFYEKWKVASTIESGTIPLGEKISMEILIDDPSQLPTPIRKLFDNGDYDQLSEDAAIIKGRRGVLVTFDASLGSQGPGSIAQADVYIHKAAFTETKTAQMNFGEHSDKGVYSPYSESLQVGSSGGKLDFTIYPDGPSVINTETSSMVTWKILKQIPDGCWDSDVSIRVGIPNNTGELEWKIIVMEKGSFLQDVVTNQYQKNAFVDGVRFITPTVDTSFNELWITVKALTNYVVETLPEGTGVVPASTPDVFVTGIRSSVINGSLAANAAIFYNWDKTNDYFVKGGLITVDQLLVRRELETDKILGIQFYPTTMIVTAFRVADKINYNIPYKYDLYLHVKSMNGSEGQDPAEGYSPFDYYLAVGGISMFPTREVSFNIVNDAIPVLTIPNVTTTIPTRLGVSIIYNHLINKYYADGISTSTANGEVIVGNLYGVLLPKEQLYIRDLQLTPLGSIIYADGILGEVFTMDEFSKSGLDKPIVDLKIATVSMDKSTYVVSYQANLRNGVASQDMTVWVTVVNEYNHSIIPVTSISILKGEASGEITAHLATSPVSYRISMEFAVTGNENEGFIYGDSPADVVVSSFKGTTNLLN